jgi:hypothetical protein
MTDRRSQRQETSDRLPADERDRDAFAALTAAAHGTSTAIFQGLGVCPIQSAAESNQW